MGKLPIFIIIISLLFYGLVGCTSEPDSPSTPKAFSNPEQVINVSQDENFFIALVSEKRDLGYRWGAHFDGSMLSLIKTTVQQNRDSRTETGDIEWFEFKATKAGECKVSLVYMQWLAEGGTKPLDEKVFTINIR
jgi:predicted secreted protein